MISYYELLNLIKQGDTPQRVWFHIGNRRISYVKDIDNIDLSFNGYIIEDKDKKEEDIKYWLGENFLESDMFNECLTFEQEKVDKIDFSSLHTQREKNRAFRKSINAIIDRLDILEKRYENK